MNNSASSTAAIKLQFMEGGLNRKWDEEKSPIILGELKQLRYYSTTVSLKFLQEKKNAMLINEIIKSHD